MSQVQHSFLHNVIQPFVFLTTGFLAGRMIEYFPGATETGLMLSSGFGTVLTLGSQFFAPYPEKELSSFIRVIASLAIGSIITPLASKTLLGRTGINFSAGGRFLLLESVAAGGITLISHFMKPDLRTLHHQYTQDPSLLMSLTLLERDEFIRASFYTNLPPIFLSYDGIQRITSIPFEFGDFHSMKNNQLLWCAEIVRTESFHSYERMANLYTVLHKRNLPMHGSARSSHAMARNEIISPDVRKAYFASNPLGYFINSGWLNDLFTEEEKPDPAQYDLNEIRTLSYTEICRYLEAFNHCNREMGETFDHSLPPEIRVVFSGAVHAKGIYVDQDVTDHRSLITQRVIDIIKEDDHAFEWFYAEYSIDPDAYTQIDPLLQNQLNEYIQSKGKEPIS